MAQLNLILIVIVFGILGHFPSWAQEDSEPRDPFLGNYILGNNSELFLLYADPANDGILKSKSFDFSNDDLSPAIKDSSQILDVESFFGDVCIGELNGDLTDDIVKALIKKDPSNNMLFNIVLSTETDEYMAGSLYMTENGPSFKISVVDLDPDAQKEIILAYWGDDYKIHLHVFETDSDLNIIELSSNSSLPLNPELGKEACFDMCAVDINNDAIDEIAVVRNMEAVYGTGSETITPHFEFDLSLFDCSVEAYQLNQKSVKTLSFSEPKHDISKIKEINNLEKLAIAGGNISGDNTNELLIAYSYKFIDVRNIESFNMHASIVPISITKSSIADEELILEYMLDDYSIMPLSKNLFDDPTKYHTMSYALDIICKDVNHDNYDEIFLSGLNYIQLIFPLDEDQKLDFTFGNGIPADAYVYNNITPSTFLVADLNADTLDLNPNDSSINWNPEIIVVGYGTNPYESGYSDTLRVSVYDFKNTDKFPFVRLNSSPKARIELPGMKYKFYCISSGDLDGDGLRFGKPKIIDKKAFKHPTVILNAPPVHYDILPDENGNVYDVCMVFGQNEPAFKAKYETVQTSTNLFQTEFYSDWGRSADLSAKCVIAGSGVGQIIDNKYGNKFSKTHSKKTEYGISLSATADIDDYIYTFETKYNLWEYPVYFRHNLLGQVLVVNPMLETQKHIWKEGRSWKDHGYIFNHEIGNILSYAGYIEDSLKLQFNDFRETFSISETSEFSEEIKYTNIVNDKSELSYSSGYIIDKFTKLGYEGEVSAEIGAEPFGVGMSFGTSYGIDIGFEFGAKNFYSHDEITTHTTTVSENWRLLLELGKTDKTLGQANYDVTPYVYWSYDGALVLDYYVEPTGTWWDLHYGSFPDLAFILPNRYLTEKGGAFTPGYEYQRFNSPDIMINPTLPVPGDTLELIARIHNYSLCSIPDDDKVSVTFYYGDPDNGGVQISNILKEGRSWKYDIKEPRGQTYFYIECITPADILEVSRIYAVIDPDNTIEEIHENNNKGYLALKREELNTILALNKESELSWFQCYPNPFTSDIDIKYSLPQSAGVRIAIYDMLGQKVKILTNKQKPIGEHTVNWNGTNQNGARVPNGIYICKMMAGGISNSSKILLLD